MQKASHYLEKYLRRLAKELIILLPFFLLVVLGYNFFFKPTLFEKTKNAAAANPTNYQAKYTLGTILLASNNLDAAQYEFEKILNSNASLVLKKDASEKLALVISKKQTPTDLQNQIIFWQNQNKLYPNSRDILLKLAILNWQLYRVFEARKYLALALVADPNNEKSLDMKHSLELN